ncbi:MAG: hypothetical protein K0R12_804 [Gammaproteobacteria bacterium]|nr:hypothetical protein [Gammaproteobacteria bacterium]
MNISFFSYAAANETNSDKTPLTLLHENSLNTLNSDSIFSQEGFSLSGYHDSVLGFVGEAKVSSYLFDSQHAAALELNGGPRIFRLNATYGVNVSNHQRIKVTGERLDEKLDFDFVGNDFTSDTVSQWVGQNALGADYAYMLNNKTLQSLGFGGYYTHSPSKDIASETLHDSVNNLDYLEQRRIAGANSGNAHLNLATHLWPYSRLSGGLDYDTVRFDTQYADQDVQGFGGHAKMEQRLFPTLKLTLSSELRQTEHGYSAGLSWLTPSIKGMPTEIEALTEATNDLTSHQHYYTTGLRFNVAFDDTVGGAHQATYADLSETGSQQSLIEWTKTPAVRMSTVLAVADGSVVPGFMSCPATVTGDGTGNYSASDGWYQTNAPSPYIGDASFVYATFDTSNPSSGICTYEINDLGTHTVNMTNHYSGAKTGKSSNWINTSGTLYRCNRPNHPEQCQFVDTRIMS